MSSSEREVALSRWHKVGLGARFASAAQMLHQRKLKQMAAHGDATTEVEEKALRMLKLWQQGDASMYEASAVEQRYANREHPDVVEQLENWWKIVKRFEAGLSDDAAELDTLHTDEQARSSAVIHKLFAKRNVVADFSKALAGRSQLSKHSYCEMYVRVSKALLEDDEPWDEEEARQLVEAAWTSDARGKPSMTRLEFNDALFECADMWTSSAEAEEYADFLRRLVTHLCGGDPERATCWASIDQIDRLQTKKASLADRTSKGISQKMRSAVTAIQGKARRRARKKELQRRRTSRGATCTGGDGSSCCERGATHTSGYSRGASSARMGASNGRSAGNVAAADDESNSASTPGMDPREAAARRAAKIMAARKNGTNIGFGSSVSRNIFAATVVQARARSMTQRTEFKKARSAATLVQGQVRTCLHRWAFLRAHASALRIQRVWRGETLRKHMITALCKDAQPSCSPMQHLHVRKTASVQSLSLEQSAVLASRTSQHEGKRTPAWSSGSKLSLRPTASQGKLTDSVTHSSPRARRLAPSNSLDQIKMFDKQPRYGFQPASPEPRGMASQSRARMLLIKPPGMSERSGASPLGFSAVALGPRAADSSSTSPRRRLPLYQIHTRAASGPEVDLMKGLLPSISPATLEHRRYVRRRIVGRKASPSV